MFKNVIFDWSGVICDDAYAVYQADMDMFKEFGVKPISFEEYRREWEMPFMNFLHKYIPNLTMEQQKEIFPKNIAKYQQNKLFPGADITLKKLSDNQINLFIVSSDIGIIINTLNQFNLKNLFTEVIYKVHDKTESVRNLVQKYNLNPGKTIFIGDTNHEIETSQTVGIKSGAVTWGYCLEEKLKTLNPDFLIHDFSQLEQIVLK
jgi:phosphoglycolate phosphatase-like HAD superfamily hydrolase